MKDHMSLQKSSQRWLYPPYTSSVLAAGAWGHVRRGDNRNTVGWGGGERKGVWVGARVRGCVGRRVGAWIHGVGVRGRTRGLVHERKARVDGPVHKPTGKGCMGACVLSA